MVFLRRPEVLASCKNFVGGVCMLANNRLVNPTTQPGQAVRPNVRVVLAAFIAAFFPLQCFERMGELETKYHNSSVALLQHMQNLAGVLQTAQVYADVPTTMLVMFVLLLRKYLQDFREWKDVDIELLSGRLQRGLTALYDTKALHQELGTAEAERLVAPLDGTINRLRTKLMQVCGQRTLDAFDAMAQNRAAIPNRQGEFAAFELTALTIAKEAIGNENVTYELLLDANYQLRMDQGSFISKSVAPLVDDFYDGMLEDLRAGRSQRAVRLLKAVRDGLCERLTTASPVYLQVCTLINTANIVESNTLFDRAASMQFFEGVIALMRQQQTQERSEQTRVDWELMRNALQTAEDTAQMVRDILKFLQGLLDTMRIDVANARLTQIAPVIREHGVHYLRGKFEAKHPNPTKTLQWLSQQVNETNVQQLAQRDLATLRAVHRSALVDYITTAEPGSLPEVLVLDVYRIECFNEQYKKLVDNATLMLTVGQAVYKVQWAGGLQDVSAHEVKPLLEVISEMILAHSATTPEDVTTLHRFIEQIVPGLTGDTSTGLLQEMQEALSPTYEGREIT